MESERISDKNATGKLPEVLPSPLKLNLGCGTALKQNYINIDLYSDSSEVVLMDVRQLDFSNESVDEIFASNILEYISQEELLPTLLEWARVLKLGGLLNLQIPSLELQAKAYLRGDWDADVSAKMLYGNQINPKDFLSNTFDTKSIKKHLEKAGFRIINISELDISQKDGISNLNMEVEAQKSPAVNISTENISGGIADLDFELDEEVSENIISNEEILFDLELLKELVDKDIATNKPVEDVPQLNIVWEGSQFIYHSFAQVNREQCFNIIQSNAANLTIVPYGEDTFDFKLKGQYIELRENDIRYKKPVNEEIGNLPYAWIRHQWPPNPEAPKGAKWIIMQPWEYNRIPIQLFNVLEQANEIWTPSSFSKNSFVNSGIDEEKVHIIPNGINPEVFTPYGKKFKLTTEKNFKLLFLGGTLHRKGIDILLRSFTASFADTDDICLVIKDMGTDTFYKGQTIKEQINEIANADGAPEILYYSEDMEEEDIAALYRSCDLLVSPYRGEGFSLPTLEAMACGLVPVVTRGGATDDFVKENMGFFINTEKKSAGTKIADFEFEEEVVLLEPDEKHLSQILMFLYNNPGILPSIGMIASSYARSQWNWKNANLKMFSRLDALYNTNMAVVAAKNLPDIQDDYIKLGYAEEKYSEGVYAESYLSFKKLLSSSKMNKEHLTHILIRMAILDIDKKDYDSALSLLKTAESENKNAPDIKYLYAVYHSAKNEFNKALEYVTEVLEVWKEHKFNSSYGINLDDILVLGGDIMRGAKDLEGAVEMYKKALEMNHENYYACYGAGVCYMYAGANDTAKEMFNWALKYNPSYQPALKAIQDLENN